MTLSDNCPLSRFEIDNLVIFSYYLDEDTIIAITGKIIGKVYEYVDYWSLESFKQGWTYYIRFYHGGVTKNVFRHESELEAF